MNARDLVLVCLVAGVAGAGAAFAASVLHDAAPPPGIPDELAARLDRIENSLARVAETQKDAKESAARLADRVTSLQIDVGAAREEAAKAVKAATEPAEDVPAQDEAGARPGRARRPLSFSLGNRGSLGELAGGHIVLGGKDGAEGAILETRALTDEVSKRFAAFSQGLKLRLLPEEERWKKAQDELRLSDGQVQVLKDAIAERDKTMQEMMQVETSADEGGGSKITIKRLDPLKAAQAQTDYQRKVGQALDTEQKKSWDEKGYDSAFGGPAGGRSIAVVQSMDVNFEDGKSAK